MVVAATACLSACATGSAPTGVPTQLLIPATATFTPIPPTETPTPPPGLRPEDVLNRASPVLVTITAEAERTIAEGVLDDLITTQGLTENLVRLVQMETVDWADEEPECSEDTSTEVRRAFTAEGYRLLWVSAATAYDYHTIGEVIRLCSITPVRALTGETLMRVDPVAAELVSLAQRRLADDLDLTPRNIRVLDVRAVTWPDSGLGCPQPDQVYETRVIQGYHLRLGAGETEYAFNTDFDRLVPCEVDDVVLPESS